MEEIQSIHLRDEYVELIRNGRKSIEGRLNRQPYINILEGQTLRYYKGFTRRLPCGNGRKRKQLGPLCHSGYSLQLVI